MVNLKKNKCGNAERRRRKNRGAPRGVGCGEGVSPPHRGMGLGRGLCPLPRKILKFSSQNGEFWCNMKCYFKAFQSLLLHANWNFNSTQYPIIIPFTPMCLTYSFWYVKPAAYGFWLLVVPLLYHSVIPLNFATSCLHNVDVPCTAIAIGCRAQQRKPGCAFHEPQIQNATAMQSIVTQRGSTYVAR